MSIDRIVVKNYRSLRDVSISFNQHLNIIVGDNETGKSTILEAINLVLSGQLNGRSLQYELHPFLFNTDAITEYLAQRCRNQNVETPEILIEVYLSDSADLAKLRGTNNSLHLDQPGVRLVIRLDDTFSVEYQNYFSDPSQVQTLPMEYFEATWWTFADEVIKPRNIPLRTLMVDASRISNNAGANKYVIDMIRDILEPKQIAEVSLAYRNLKNAFQQQQTIMDINQTLASSRSEITDKQLSVALDTLSKSGWDTGIVPYLDTIPLPLIGKGEQSAIKIKLAMVSGEPPNIFLIEEPENHLSFSNLNKLIDKIRAKAEGKQLIITTHSSFVLNKLGIENVILFDGKKCARLNELPSETFEYFMKLPGHDTLRLILAKRVILVEGPSDELIVQKAYLMKYGKMPLDDGVDVITVASLAFKRFLDIAKLLTSVIVRVVTDNDGNVKELKGKYKDYFGMHNVKICFDDDEHSSTLEPQLVRINDQNTLNQILGKSYSSPDDILAFMSRNKTDSALAFFNTDIHFEIPEYINDAITF